MKYRFTYEVTSNCNYNCNYCIVFKKEEFSNLNTINNIINFFTELDKLEDTEYIEIQLFGGECTLHPLFLYIVEELSKLDSVKFILFTNLSADIKVYDQFCKLAKGHIYSIATSFHYNHCNELEYKSKIKYLLDNYPDININNNCMLSKGRYTENDYVKIFSEFKLYNNFRLSLFPILDNCENVVVVSADNINDKNNNIKLNIDKNTKNLRYNKYCDCFSSNAFINSSGILFPCFEKLNGIRLNLSLNNIINTYKQLCKLKIKCNKLTCYMYAKWETID